MPRLPFQPNFLAGKAALVTGGTSGIGLAIALALAEHGCQVLATGVDDVEVDGLTVPAELQGLLSARQLDVARQQDIDRVMAGCARLDILVNAAGIIRRGGAEFAMDAFEQVIDVNLHGAMRMAIACRPLLAGTAGVVLNIASMLSQFGSGQAPAYSASKGGVVQLTRSLAIAWAAQGIRVNALAPGWIETPLTRPLYEDPDRRQTILDRTPLGRWGRPQDVVGPALFLCSPAAAFVTGAVLCVDGGYSVM